MFEKVILDDKSFERRGANSVHNLLKANIWIIDRNYSILHDDETLKNIIYAQWDKQIKEDASEQRPDFLCMVDPLSEERDYKRLVIIEIKKPSVKLSMKHVEQIMAYKTILEKHSGKSVDDFTCYIVGREINPFLKANDLSKAGFITKTYADFIREARRFYEEYKKIIEKEALAF